MSKISWTDVALVLAGYGAASLTFTTKLIDPTYLGAVFCFVVAWALHYKFGNPRP